MRNGVAWSLHGVYAAGKTLDETFGLVEAVEKAAQLYMLTLGHPRVNELTDKNMKELCDLFGVLPKAGYLSD